uniref:Beta-defensin-like domain-containing protein n=1 Tax=Chelonoidis abingdonii TaxID=106734 RepID=A0A8C0GGS6_CHEAB
MLGAVHEQDHFFRTSFYVLWKFLVVKGTLFLHAGFTQFINNPAACRRAWGFCLRTCYPYSTSIGTCSAARSCCRRKVSSGCHNGDITVQTEYLCL